MGSRVVTDSGAAVVKGAEAVTGEDLLASQRCEPVGAGGKDGAHQPGRGRDRDTDLAEGRRDWVDAWTQVIVHVSGANAEDHEGVALGADAGPPITSGFSPRL